MQEEIQEELQEEARVQAQTPALRSFAVDPLGGRPVAARETAAEPRALGPADYESIFRHSVDGVLLTVPDGQVLAANPAACEILRLTEVEICERGRSGLLFGDDPATRAAVAERARVGHARAEVPMLRGDGEVFAAEISSAIFTTREGAVRACVIFRDVSEQVALRAQLERQARLLEEQSLRDPLTGLRNRRGFLPAAEEALAIADREGKPAQLLFFDVDDLKKVNDSHGHGVGDQAIRRLAAAIGAETRAADISARLGGDEFVLLLFSASENEAHRVVSRIREALAGDGDRPSVSFSVGIASPHPGTTATLDDLLERADRGMYRAKVRRRLAP